MAKKIIKKRKLKIFPFLLILLILGGISFAIYVYIQTPIQNLLVKNTTYLNDDYILELAGVKEYSSSLWFRVGKMEENLLSSPYIEDVHISKRFYRTLVIEVTENQPLFINSTDQTVVFKNNETVPVEEEIDLFRIPRLMNYVPDDKYDSFIKGMGNIQEDVLGKISDIEYQPNDYDKDRFLLYMDDGNMVYLTLTKFKMINYYNDVLSQLEDRKGILYLDNGNHFQIME